MLALLCLIFAATPQSEAIDAAKDISQINIVDAPYIRYLSIYNFEEQDRKDAVNVMNFWVNSLSRRSNIRSPKRVTSTLYRLDIREYDWNAKAWEDLIVKDDKFVRKEPYFAASLLDYDAEYKLRELTKSYGAIMRLDYFVANTCFEPHYSAFLNIPPNLKKLFDEFYVRPDDVKKLGLQRGGAVLESIVALHNRQLERWPTITGAFWLSRDSGTSVKKQSVLENIFEIEHDAGEFIWNLPNGLQAYYLADNKGVQQEEVPANLAIDSKTPLQDKRVRNAFNCVTCHEIGINPFDNVIAKMIKSGATYASYNKEEALLIEEYHLSPLAEQIEEDNDRFAKAVERCNGLEPNANARAFEKLVMDYVEDRIDLDMAAKEVGCDVELLKEKLPLLYLGTANALLVGERIPRDSWESIAYKVALLCCAKEEREGVLQEERVLIKENKK